VNVAELMTRHVEFVGGDESVKEAAVLMGELDVGALPVGSAERLDGIVTDRDILYRVVARGLDPSVVRVREVASRPVIACAEDDTLQAAMDLMAAHHVRRLPVRDGSGLVTGWVTLADLSRQLIVGNDALQAALRDLTEAAAAAAA
jgi:CBS domain-containing protein